MTTITPEQPTIGYQRWEKWTQPHPSLDREDRQKARTLAAMLLIFLPLSLLTIFLTPLRNILTGNPVVMPTPPSFLAIGLIILAYYFSRSAQYTTGAWIMISAPILALGLPPILNGTPTSEVGLSFLTLSVVLTSLTLTARATVIAGVVAMAMIVGLPGPESKLTLVGLILIITTLMVLVSRIRERYLLELEAARAELQQRITEAETIQVELQNASAEIADRATTEQGTTRASRISDGPDRRSHCGFGRCCQ